MAPNNTGGAEFYKREYKQPLKKPVTLDDCVCDTCTCGKHFCPKDSFTHLPKGGKFYDSTEYARNYHEIDCPVRRRLLKPPHEKLDGGLFEGRTTHRDDYKEYPIERQMAKAKVEYRPPTAPMNGVSSYTTDYVDKPGGKRVSFKPQRAYTSPQIPMHDDTIHRSSYYPYSREEMAGSRQDSARHPGQFTPRSGEAPMSNSTTFKDDYKNFGTDCRTLPIIPQQNRLMPSDPTNFTTNYKKDYVDKSGVAERHKPRQKLPYKPSTEPLSGLTTMRKDYQDPPNPQKAVSFKPLIRYEEPQVPVDCRTIHREDYTEYPTLDKVMKPEWAKRNKYEKPTAPFKGISCYDQDYVPLEGLGKTQPVKHKTNMPVEKSGPLASDTEFSSNYIDQFGKHQPRQSFKKFETYNYPNIKMDGVSTFRDHYQGLRALPADPIRGKGFDFNAHTAGLPMQDITSYRHDYKGNVPLRCIYQGVNYRPYLVKMQKKPGHYLYRPLGTQQVPVI